MNIFHVTKTKAPGTSLQQIFVAFFIFFLVYTAGYKALNIEAFQFNIGRTAIFPSEMISVVSYGIILTEGLVVLILLIKPRMGVLFYTILMSIFTIYILFLFFTGRYEVCGCGGILNGLGFKPHLLINLSQILLGMITLNLNTKK